MVFAYFLRKVKYERDHEKEYMVKAAMLVKFHKLTTWPNSAKPEDSKTVNICVVGENPFSAKARSLFASASTPERQYKFVKGEAYKKKFCHIVFIGNCSKKKLEDTLNALESVPTLTVSDTPGFASMGGNIEFVVEMKSDQDQKIKLIVNEQAALEKGLTFDKEIKNSQVSTMIRKSN